MGGGGGEADPESVTLTPLAGAVLLLMELQPNNGLIEAEPNPPLMACIDTLTAGSAILSFSVKSLMVLMFGLVVTR